MAQHIASVYVMPQLYILFSKTAKSYGLLCVQKCLSEAEWNQVMEWDEFKECPAPFDEVFS